MLQELSKREDELMHVKSFQVRRCNTCSHLGCDATRPQSESDMLKTHYSEINYTRSARMDTLCMDELVTVPKLRSSNLSQGSAQTRSPVKTPRTPRQEVDCEIFSLIPRLSSCTMSHDVGNTTPIRSESGVSLHNTVTPVRTPRQTGVSSNDTTTPRRTPREYENRASSHTTTTPLRSPREERVGAVCSHTTTTPLRSPREECEGAVCLHTTTTPLQSPREERVGAVCSHTTTTPLRSPREERVGAASSHTTTTPLRSPREERVGAVCSHTTTTPLQSPREEREGAASSHSTNLPSPSPQQDLFSRTSSCASIGLERRDSSQCLDYMSEVTSQGWWIRGF